MENDEIISGIIISGFFALLVLILSVYKHNMAELERDKVFAAQGLEQKLDGSRIIWVKVRDNK
jgi:hypothetical protein